MTIVSNSYYLQTASPDEVTLKNNLWKGHHRLLWGGTSNLTVQTGSSVEINGKLYYANSGNAAFLSAPAANSYVSTNGTDWKATASTSPPTWDPIRNGYYYADNYRCVAQYVSSVMQPIRYYIGVQ